MSSSNNEVGGNHYKKLKISPVEYIRANNLDFFEGNVVKYVSRHRYKNGEEDIIKCVDYLRMILEDEYGKKLIFRVQELESSTDEQLVAKAK